jgi:hypothetical protein
LILANFTRIRWHIPISVKIGQLLYIKTYMHFCAWKWTWNCVWGIHRQIGARHPAHAKVTDPRKLRCHWQHLQRLCFNRTKSLP